MELYLKNHIISINKNPFNFKHFDIREASIIVNGVNEPAELYKLNIDNGDKVDMFASFLDNWNDRELGVSLDGYYRGSFLLALDRTPDNCSRHRMGSGAIDFNVKTGTALTETVTAIVYATYSPDIIVEDGRVYYTTIKKCGNQV